MYFVKLHFLNSIMFDLIYKTEEKALEAMRRFSNHDGRDCKVVMPEEFEDDFGHRMMINMGMVISVSCCEFEDSHRRGKVVNELNDALTEKYETKRNMGIGRA